jgi:hypothetical protein
VGDGDDSTGEGDAPKLKPDVREIRDICSHIEKIVGSPASCKSAECIGYLETPKAFKHLFYSNGRDRVGGVGGKIPEEEMITLKQLIESSDTGHLLLDAASRLKLSHRIATTVLQYHSTPWLADQWRLKDLAFFGGKQLSDEALRTLHLTHSFTGKHQDMCLPSALSGRAESDSEEISEPERMKFEYGISNVPLFGLGIALLEIAHQKPLESMIDEQDPIAAVRRLAASSRPLGSRHQRIVEQCLQCNFGMGTDLCNEDLQRGVYTDVICRLEEMVNSLTLD